MLSRLAFLRILVLPSGAINGPRIILNGLTGRIELYNASNELVGSWDPDSTQGLRLRPGPTGGGEIRLLPDSGTGLPVIGLDPPNSPVIGNYNAGQIYADWQNTDETPFITLVAPTIPGEVGNPLIRLFGPNPTGLTPVGRIDLAPNAQGGTDGYVDIPDAGSNVDFRIDNHTVGRGIVPNGVFETNVSDVARAPGVNTDASVTATFKASRRYEATVLSQFTGGVAGGIYALDILEDGVLIGRIDRVDLEAGTATGFFRSAFLYTPTTDGSHTMVLRNNAGSAGTVTLTAGAGQPRQFWFKDVGAP